MEVRAERMRPHQIAECREKADIAFLPLGSLEWHGVQNPIGTDSLKAHNICCRAAEILGGGAVFPPLYWGLPKDSFDVARVQDVAEVASKVYNADLERMNSPMNHGGKWETSHMLAVDEKMVDLAQITEHPELKGVGAGVDAVDATREQGEAWVKQCAEAIAGEARWLADNYPEIPPHHRHRRGSAE
ncbi:MAG: creatininase family protein [Planctomycetota bacterium]